MTATPARPSAHKFLSDPEIHAHIVRYKGGDEQAIVPVVEHFRDRARRQAVKTARDTNGKLDASDVESAIVASMFEALDRFDPAVGVPFGAFFKQFRRAAINDERARLSGRSALRRKTFDVRGRVLRAAEELRKELAAQAGGSSGQSRHRPPLYQLDPAFTDADAQALWVDDDTVRTQSLGKLVLDVDQYLASALPDTVDAAQRRALTIDKLKALRTASRPRTRAEIEQTLSASLTYTVTRLGRTSAPAHRTSAEFYAMVGERARVSPELARDLLEDDTTVSLDADSSKTNASGKGGVLGDRIGASDEGAPRNTLFAQFSAVLDLAPDFPRFAYALHNGLHGYRARSTDQIAAGFGMSTTQADQAIRQARAVVQSAAVADLLFGRGEDALVEHDPLRDIQRAAAVADRQQRAVAHAADAERVPTPDRIPGAAPRFASVDEAIEAVAAFDARQAEGDSIEASAAFPPLAVFAPSSAAVAPTEVGLAAAATTASGPSGDPDGVGRGSLPAEPARVDPDDEIPPRRRIADETPAPPSAEASAPTEVAAPRPRLKTPERSDQYGLFDLLG